jgi:hypothetical protein
MVMVNNGRVSFRLLYQNRRIGPGVQAAVRLGQSHYLFSAFFTMHQEAVKVSGIEGALAARLPQSRTLARPEQGDRCDVRKLQEAQENDGLDSSFEDRLLGLNIHRPSRGCV